jgi:hypothetical protein
MSPSVVELNNSVRASHRGRTQPNVSAAGKVGAASLAAGDQDVAHSTAAQVDDVVAIVTASDIARLIDMRRLASSRPDVGHR